MVIRARPHVLRCVSGADNWDKDKVPRLETGAYNHAVVVTHRFGLFDRTI